MPPLSRLRPRKPHERGRLARLQRKGGSRAPAAGKAVEEKGVLKAVTNQFSGDPPIGRASQGVGGSDQPTEKLVGQGTTRFKQRTADWRHQHSMGLQNMPTSNQVEGVFVWLMEIPSRPS